MKRICKHSWHYKLREGFYERNGWIGAEDDVNGMTYILGVCLSMGAWPFAQINKYFRFTFK